MTYLIWSVSVHIHFFMRRDTATKIVLDAAPNKVSNGDFPRCC
ncbi:hypothetical protein [Brevibacterium sp. HMSC08F02]|nr:hypothetical protein [Brevibacterium sp. HMSC08F02]